MVLKYTTYTYILIRMNQSLGYRGGAFFGVDHSLAGFRTKLNREAYDEDLLANQKVRNRLFAHIAAMGDEVVEPSLKLQVMVGDVSMRIQKFLDTVTAAQASVDNTQQPIFEPNQLDLSPLSERWNELVRAVNPYLTGPNNQLLSDEDSNQLKQMITNQLQAPVTKLKTDIGVKLQNAGLMLSLNRMVINAEVLFGQGLDSIENQIEDEYYLPVRYGPQRGAIQMGVPGPAAAAAPPAGMDYGLPDEEPDSPRTRRARMGADILAAIDRQRQESRDEEQLDDVYGRFDSDRFGLAFDRRGNTTDIPGEAEEGQRLVKLIEKENEAEEKRRRELKKRVADALQKQGERAAKQRLERMLSAYEGALDESRQQLRSMEEQSSQTGDLRREIRGLQQSLERTNETRDQLRQQLGLAQQRETALQRQLDAALESTVLGTPQTSRTTPASSASSARPSALSPGSTFSESRREVVPISSLQSSPSASVASPSSSASVASPSPAPPAAPSLLQRGLQRVSQGISSFLGRPSGERTPQTPRRQQALPADVEEVVDLQSPLLSASRSPGIEQQNRKVYDSKPSKVRNPRQRLEAHASMYGIDVPQSSTAAQILDVLTESRIALPTDFWTEAPGTESTLRTSITSPLRGERARNPPQRFNPERGFGKTDYDGPLDMHAELPSKKRRSRGGMVPAGLFSSSYSTRPVGYVRKRKLPAASYEGFNDNKNEMYMAAPPTSTGGKISEEIKHMPILMGNRGLPKIYGRERQLKNLGFYKPRRFGEES